MTGFQFARLKIEGPYPLRRGAWYRVTDETSETVVFDVNRRPVTVPRSLVELVGGPPRLWTIVPRPVNAVRVPAHWGWWYAVCPSCKHRSALNAAPQTMRCPRCKGVFRFAREEGPAATRAVASNPGPAVLAPAARRVVPRRGVDSHRSDPQRQPAAAVRPESVCPGPTDSTPYVVGGAAASRQRQPPPGLGCSLRGLPTLRRASAAV